ncbi:MAG: winged helix-turn-helix transcriptional regulator [Candidatus Thermoplasmatota archaeon]
MARAFVVLLLVALMPVASARELDAASSAPACPLGVDVDVRLVQAEACVERVSRGLPQVTTDLRVALTNPLLPSNEASPDNEGMAPQSEWHDEAAGTGGVPAHSPLGRTAAGMSIAAALTALVWTLLRAFGVAPLLPFFSRIEDDQLTAHPARRAALEVIQANPGATIQDIQAALGLAWGTTVHHLRRLDRAGLIAVRRDGGRRGHWPLGQAPPRDGLSSADRAVAALVKSAPGLTQRDIARMVGVGAPAACKRLTRLEEVGLVAQVREGRSRLYVPTGRLLALDVKLPSVVRSVTPALAETDAPLQATPLQTVVATMG